MRRLAAVFYCMHLLLRTGILLYAPSLVLAQILHIDLKLAIVVSAAVAIFYTWFGGIKAVIWTDVMQFCVFLSYRGSLRDEVKPRLSKDMERARSGYGLDTMRILSETMTLREMAVSFARQMDELQGFGFERPSSALVSRFEREVLGKVSTARRYLTVRTQWLSSWQQLSYAVNSLLDNQEYVVRELLDSARAGFPVVRPEGLGLPDSMAHQLDMLLNINEDLSHAWARIDNDAAMLNSEELIQFFQMERLNEIALNAKIPLVFYFLTLVLLLSYRGSLRDEVKQNYERVSHGDFHGLARPARIDERKVVVADAVLDVGVFRAPPVVQRVRVHFHGLHVVAHGNGGNLALLDSLDGLWVGDCDCNPQVDAVKFGIRPGEPHHVLLHVTRIDHILRVLQGDGLGVRRDDGFGRAHLGFGAQHAHDRLSVLAEVAEHARACHADSPGEVALRCPAQQLRFKNA